MQLEHNQNEGKIEELQEKLAQEFNKKRQAKQEHEQQIAEMVEELEYTKEKYHEVKELLSNCTEQLKQFEDLNQMRNDVIERLERDNALLLQ